MPAAHVTAPNQSTKRSRGSLEVAAGAAVPVSRLGLHVGLGAGGGAAAAAHAATVVGGRVIPVPSTVPLLPGLGGVCPPARSAIAVGLRSVPARSSPVARCSPVPARSRWRGGRRGRRRRCARPAGPAGGCTVLRGRCAAQTARPGSPSSRPALRAPRSPTAVALCAPCEVVVATGRAHPVPCTTTADRHRTDAHAQRQHTTHACLWGFAKACILAHAGPEHTRCCPHTALPRPTHAHTCCPACCKHKPTRSHPLCCPAHLAGHRHRHGRRHHRRSLRLRRHRSCHHLQGSIKWK